MPHEIVPPDGLIALLDTTTVDPTQVSCIATALREARSLVGRDPSTGRVERPEHGVTWAGALVYLIYCEQIGSCFHPDGHQHRRRRSHEVADALIWFGGFEVAQAELLRELRNRLAHNYTLRPPHPGGPTFALHGGVREPVVRRIDQHVLVGLPALAHRIETVFNLSLMLLVDEHQLACHHRDGFGGVNSRFWMSILTDD